MVAGSYVASQEWFVVVFDLCVLAGFYGYCVTVTIQLPTNIEYGHR